LVNIKINNLTLLQGFFSFSCLVAAIQLLSFKRTFLYFPIFVLSFVLNPTFRLLNHFHSTTQHWII